METQNLPQVLGDQIHNRNCASFVALWRNESKSCTVSCLLSFRNFQVWFTQFIWKIIVSVFSPARLALNMRVEGRALLLVNAAMSATLKITVGIIMTPPHDTNYSMICPLWRLKYAKFIVQKEQKKKDASKMKVDMNEVKINNKKCSNRHLSPYKAVIVHFRKNKKWSYKSYLFELQRGRYIFITFNQPAELTTYKRLDTPSFICFMAHICLDSEIKEDLYKRRMLIKLQITSLGEAKAIHTSPQRTADVQKCLTLAIIRATCTGFQFLHILHWAEVCSLTASQVVTQNRPGGTWPFLCTLMVVCKAAQCTGSTHRASTVQIRKQVRTLLQIWIRKYCVHLERESVLFCTFRILATYSELRTNQPF